MVWCSIEEWSRLFQNSSFYMNSVLGCDHILHKLFKNHRFPKYFRSIFAFLFWFILVDVFKLILLVVLIVSNNKMVDFILIMSTTIIALMSMQDYYNFLLWFFCCCFGIQNLHSTIYLIGLIIKKCRWLKITTIDKRFICMNWDNSNWFTIYVITFFFILLSLYFDYFDLSTILSHSLCNKYYYYYL